MIELLRPSTIGRHTVVRLEGEIDLACAPQLRDGLLGLLNRGVDSLVVDLRDVTFIDSTGVGCLLRVFHRQTLLGGSAHFLVGTSAVRQVLDLMQLTRRLHVTEDLAEVDRCCPPLVVAPAARATSAAH